MDTEKTLLEEAEEEIGGITRDEREFFLYQQKVNGLLFGKTKDSPSTDLPVIRAKCLSWLLNKLVGKRFDSSLFINIQEVHVQGNVTCDHIVFTKSLYLTGCYFSDEVDLFQSTFSNLVFQEVKFDKKVKAEGICVKNNFAIKQSRFQGILDIQKGHVGGSLFFIGSFFGRVESEIAIHAKAIRVDGDVYFLPQLVEKEEHKFQANGSVLFEGSKIKGFFECNKGLFNAPEGLALSLAGSRIEGYISLINSDVIGIVSLNYARIGACMAIENSRFFFSDRLFESSKDERVNCQGILINIDNVQIDGHINFKNCVTDETVVLRCAQIGAHLDLSGSRFSSNFGRTLNADNIQVGGNITGTDFKSAGSISLLDARIKGILNWQQGTEICYKEGIALQADRIQARGIYLRDGFKTDGEISIPGAIIDGSLLCTNGQFFDISAENVSVKGNVHLDQLSNSDNFFQSVGKVSLHNADIDGSLVCTGGSFVDLSAPNMVVRGDVKLNGYANAAKSFICSGTVRLNNAVISGNLDCIEGSFCNSSKKALVAEHILVKNVFLYNTCITGQAHFYGAKIDGVLRVESTYWGATSSLSLDQVAAKTLLEKKDSWPAKGNLSLLGFTYESIDSRSISEVR